MKRVLLVAALMAMGAVGTVFAQNVGKPTPPPPLTQPRPKPPAYVPKPGEIVLTFPNADIGHPVKTITEKGVTFELWTPLQRSAAVPRVMFFPHLETDNNGILNAMANEQSIPVKVTFPSPVKEVTLVMWGSTDSPALVEARDKDNKLLDSSKVDKVPERKSPADPIPSFPLTVKGENIAYVLYGGAPNGGFVAAEEVRYIPMNAASAPAAAPAK